MSRKLKIFIAVIFVTILFTVISILYFQKPKVITENPAILVQISTVKSQSIPIYANTIGTLTANQQAKVSSKVSGYIKEINFKEGQFVNAGDALIQLDDSLQKQAYISSQAQTTLAKVTYQRYMELRKKNIISPQDIDQYYATYKGMLSTEAINKTTLDDMTLRAAISGYLGPKQITVGDYVNAGSEIVSITDTNILKIEYSLPSRYVSKVKEGQLITITADFLPEKTFFAKVSYISPIVDSNTQTFELHALFDNSEHLFKPGQSVNINQNIGIKQNALLIPMDAVIENINGSYVYQIQKNKVISTPISVGENYKNMMVILKGLNKGDEFISNGQFQVKIGTPVHIT